MKKMILITISLIVILIANGCKSEKEKVLALGDEKFMSGDFKTASKIYKELADKHPDFLVPQLRLASCKLCESKSYASFMNQLYLAAKSNKQFWDLLDNTRVDGPNRRVKYSYEERKNRFLQISDEIKFISEAIDKNKTNYTYYLVRGAWYVFFSDFDLAVDDFMKAQKLKPVSFESKWMIARCFSSSYGGGFHLNQSWEKQALLSVKYYLEAIELNPTNEDLISEASFQLQNVGQSQMGHSLVKEAFSKNSSSEKLLAEMAWISNVQKNYKDAGMYLEKLLKKSPQNVYYLELYGTNRILIGKRKEGLEFLRKALALVKGNNERETYIRFLINKNSGMVENQTPN